MLKFGFRAVLFVALAVSALGAHSPSAQAADTITIAVAAAFTGPAAAYGDNIKAGVSIKVEEINAAGGVNGKKVVVEYMDGQCEPRESATVSTKIAMDKDILGVVGHLCSSAHLAALPTYVRVGIPVISPTATNVSISEKNKDKNGKVWSFRNVYRDDFQGAFLARYAKEALGLNKIAVFYHNNDYGIGLKDAFVNEAKRLGLTIVGEEAYMTNAQDFTPQLTALKAKKPDGLFISGYYAEGALVANQAIQLGLNIPKFGADGLDNVDYINIAKDASNNTYMTVPFLPEAAGPEAQSFINKFKEKYNRDLDWMSANAYDATGQLLYAIEKAGENRGAVRDFLAGMNTLENGFKGITGVTYFDEHGDCQKSAYVKMVKDQNFVPAPKQL